MEHKVLDQKLEHEQLAALLKALELNESTEILLGTHVAHLKAAIERVQVTTLKRQLQLATPGKRRSRQPRQPMYA